MLESTGHYHLAVVQYLQELALPIYLMHVQRRQAGLLKSDKRDALGLALHLFNTQEKGVQSADPFLLCANWRRRRELQDSCAVWYAITTSWWRSVRNARTN